jgi:hypothetical protein
MANVVQTAMRRVRCVVVRALGIGGDHEVVLKA